MNGVSDIECEWLDIDFVLVLHAINSVSKNPDRYCVCFSSSVEKSKYGGKSCWGGV